MTLDEATDRAQSDSAEDVSEQIRGSSLLMLGRVLSMIVNLLVQVLIARTLTRDEFGYFAYALSVVTTIATFITLGIDRAVPRFVAIYDERKEWGKLAGTIVIQLTTILSLGFFAVVTVIGFQGWLSDSVIDDRQIVVVLTALVFLAPIQALDQLAVALFAVYAKPNAIFFRRYLLTPLMRLAVVGLLIANGAGPRFLAFGYVITGAIGVVLYGFLLWPLIRSQGLVPKVRSQGVSLPWKAVLGFSLPLMASDILFAVLNTSDVILLGRYRDAGAVADYRVILPAAKLNQFVMTSFALLYVPLAARMIERRDHRGLADLYWRTAAWIAVATFPMFALTFAFSDQVSVALFGTLYEDSGIYLTLLALGYYFNASLGFNGLTVKTAGKVAYTIAIAFAAIVTNLVLNIILIPEFGATGAAVATLGTLVAHNLMKQLGLKFVSGIPLAPRGVFPVYLAIGSAAAGLFVFDRILEPPLVIGIVVASAVSLLVLLATRSRLDVLATFPKVGRIPGAARLLGGGR